MQPQTNQPPRQRQRSSMALFTTLLCGLLLLLSGLTSNSANARVVDANTPKILIDANEMIALAPEQANHFTHSYLKSRRIGPTPETNNNRSVSEPQQARNLVFAYQTLAATEYLLRNARLSLMYIDEAINLAAQHDLELQMVDALAMKAELMWELHSDRDSVLTLLNGAHTRYQQAINASTQPNQNSFVQVTANLLRTSGHLWSKMGSMEQADSYFTQLDAFLTESPNELQSILHGMYFGEHLHRFERFDEATQTLIETYWVAVEFDRAEILARANLRLAKLYASRGVLDLSQAHFEQSASFYSSYEDSPFYAEVIQSLADVYYQQSKYNLALVQYFNVLEHQITRRNLDAIIDIRLSLARTYIHLFNYALAEQYLDRANELLVFSDGKQSELDARIIEATLYNLEQLPEKAVAALEPYLYAEEVIGTLELKIEGLLQLSVAYETMGETDKALKVLQMHNQLLQNLNANQQSDATRTVRTQVNSFEKAIHYRSQANELSGAQTEQEKFRKIALGLSMGFVLLILIYIQKSMAYHGAKDKLDVLSKELYTHPRSQLQNLRMINESLATSLAKSSASFEQWQLGELINEPLSDRLRFTLIEMPFMLDVYIDKGYQAGLAMEKAFGYHLRSQLQPDERLYHFSDGVFLFIQSRSEQSDSVEQLFARIQSWVSSFRHEYAKQNTLRIGFVDYPFLPRALTAINDKELIDILLLSTNIARKIQQQQPGNHWVHLQAITHAPAASFAGGDIREACIQAISQGLIKVHSSCLSEDVIKQISYD